MALLRIPLSALPLLFALVFLPGCIAFYGHRQVEVAVIDAETQAPIPDAQIHLDYPPLFTLNAPASVLGLTNAEGIATIRAANFKLECWRVSSPGYEFQYVNASKSRPNELFFELYREPVPRIKIILPQNYKGPLMIESIAVPIRDRKEKGKRKFEFKAGPNGYVLIEASPWLVRDLMYDRGVEVVDEADQPIGQGVYSREAALRSEFLATQDRPARERLVFYLGDAEGRTKLELGLDSAAFNRLFDDARDEASAHPTP